MTQQEILSLVMAGYTKADIDAMSAAPGDNLNIVSPEPLPNNYTPEPLPDFKQNQAQPQQVDFITQLAQIGAQAMLLQKPQAQPQTIAQPQTPAVEPQQVIAQTPSNSGLTPEEATKLFQAWSRGNATQDIELPPTADEVLTKRFASLYGADVTTPNN